jgi:hypothetical protein
MQSDNLIKKIDHLLQKPLAGNHLKFLRWVREKILKEDTVEFDRDYVLYLWDEFGGSPETVTPDVASIPDPPRVRETPKAQLDAPPREIETAEPKRIPNGTEAQLEQAKQTIARLRENGKKAVAQRDRWEALAKALEKEVGDLRSQNGKSDRKFEEAKRAFAKLYHPDASASRSPLERMVRGEIFKEFWAELECIELRS